MMNAFLDYYDSYPSVFAVWQVASMLQISEKRVKALIRNEELPAYLVGNAYAVGKEDLKKYIEEKLGYTREQHMAQGEDD